MHGSAAWVWEVYEAGKPMKIKNMAVECDLRTLCFGSTRGRRWISPAT